MASTLKEFVKNAVSGYENIGKISFQKMSIELTNLCNVRYTIGLGLLNS